MDHDRTQEMTPLPDTAAADPTALDSVPPPEPLLTPAKLELAVAGPALTDDHVHAAVTLACEQGIRAVIVRPSDVDQAARAMFGSTLLGSFVGFPHGSSTTAIKVYEARDAIRRGAREIHAVLNIGKLNSRQFQYVEMELIQLAQVCHEHSAHLRVIFGTTLLNEEGKLVASKIAKRSEVDSVLPALGPVPVDDEALMLKKCVPLVQLAFYRDSLDGVLAALEQGCTSVSVPQPAAILEAWKQRNAPPASAS